MLKNKIFHIEDLDLQGQTLFIRADLNVPIQDGKILNSYRIMNALPSIRYALDQKAKVILASHLGRPKGKDPALSLAPVAEMLGEMLDIDIFFVEDSPGDALEVLSPSLRQNQLILLENLRFDAGELKNDSQLAQKLAKNIDIYINDAFGVCHRRHTSLDALPRLVQTKAMGFLVKKELECLDRIRKKPDRPFTVVLGGAKVIEKLGVILSLIDHLDCLVIGGSMAYVFLKAQGFDLGKTAIEHQALSLAQELIERIKQRGKKLCLPLDHLAVPSVTKTHQVQATQGVDIPPDYQAVDIGPKTREYFRQALKNSQTIFWNGPMGIFEIPSYEQGTKALAEGIAECASAFRVVGGGDSARAVEQFSLMDQFDHVSTGGGASLAYIQGKALPGIESIQTNEIKFL